MFCPRLGAESKFSLRSITHLGNCSIGRFMNRSLKQSNLCPKLGSNTFVTPPQFSCPQAVISALVYVPKACPPSRLWSRDHSFAIRAFSLSHRNRFRLSRWLGGIQS